jgi:hypothetical protein
VLNYHLLTSLVLSQKRRERKKDALKVVLSVLVELGGSNVKTDLDLAGVTSLVDSLSEDLKGLLSTSNVGGESSLVSDVGSVNAVLLLDNALESVVSLGTHLHGLLEVLGSGREEHEFLESEGVSGVGSTVNNVESGNGEDVRGLDTGEVGEVDVERDTLSQRSCLARDEEKKRTEKTHLLGGGSLSDGHGDTEDGVSSELALVGGTVELDEELVDGLLVGDVEGSLDERRGDHVVDVGNGLVDTCESCSVSKGGGRGEAEADAPLPRYFDLSPSRSSTASWTPVEAPEGTPAVKVPRRERWESGSSAQREFSWRESAPLSVTTSTAGGGGESQRFHSMVWEKERERVDVPSTVGLPRESQI